jgi:hypothetical protein
MARVRTSVRTFTQSTPATTWTLEHNLNGNGSTGIPVVDVLVTVDGVVTKINPKSITIVDSSTVEIEFSSAQAGTAIVAV